MLTALRWYTNLKSGLFLFVCLFCCFVLFVPGECYSALSLSLKSFYEIKSLTLLMCTILKYTFLMLIKTINLLGRMLASELKNSRV